MKARREPVYIFHACLGDALYAATYRGAAIPDGARLHKCKGPGVGRAPKPFTYVKYADTGKHAGMVFLSSLTLEKASK